MEFRGRFAAFVVLGLLCATPAAAAELRGEFSGVPGASVQVSCPGGGGSARLDSAGRYAVYGLPQGRQCTFTVQAGNAHSAAIPFATTTSATVFSGRLTVRGDRVIVIRQ